MTDTRIATLCPGCFAAPGRAGPCLRCGYDEGAERSGFLLPHSTLLHGQYLVGRVLGRPGGFGITYLGWDQRFATRVAIKEYLPREWAGRAADGITVTPHCRDDEGGFFQYGLERFLTEAQTLDRIDHPNVVRVRSFFPANGTAYLVMRYYPGRSLAEHLAERGGRLPEGEARQLILPILEGLSAVHAEGFLHRDIKPDNIYLAQIAGGGSRPLLLDFGAARYGMGVHARTVIYSRGYSAPEQHHEEGNQGAWTDIYATAAVLYHLVTGKAPVGDKLRPAADFGVSKPLSDLLAAGLAIQPKDRPQTVAAFQTRLTRCVPPEPGRARPRWFWPAVVTPVLGLVGLGVSYPYHAGGPVAPVQPSADDRRHASAQAQPQADAADAARAAQRLKDADDRAFAAARTADTDPAYRAYLDACTADGCAHRVQAEQRIADLAQARRAADLNDYAAAAKQDTADAYRAYLAGCSAKGCAKGDEARASLERIAKAERDRQAAIVPAMVRIGAGSFSMGCQPGETECDDDEKPAHSVKVAAFELGKTEVTMAQFRAFVAANPGYLTEAEKGDGCYGWKDNSWVKDKAFSWRNVGFAQEDRSPVVCVSWNDAKDYVAWLSKQTGQTFRLPTEAEWEYAARAGTQTAFSTGNCIKTDQANYNGNYDYADCGAKTGVYLKKTQPVGSYPANPWGLYDLHGNVWEWVQDCYHANYTGAPKDGEEWRDSCIESGRRVLRGGSWFSHPRNLRSAYRVWDGTGNRDYDLGFRVARTLTP
ncbi:bifunctional serine/threonine-protein kinase/formylglycine-generating enzyme family protein [uncultured Thiodictyon sp.]|uniref:bifunctional serine/threonine-protein kinase/formylglycine-generating enzyme family protein n=1 Tax=uncultured Thiodictyon sp. TaxID=1846217 RepID=UPI0025D607D6|nr:bifunctional serine/threonine-protein kinase/formylglycine-generating enzyme family protein [uncultured Thiodictyon sp.]